MDSLVKTGKLRVGLFLAQYTKDPASGEYRGVGAHVVSLAVVRHLGQRLGLPVQFTGFRIPTEVVDCLKSGQCDLGIMGVDPTRAAEVDLSPAFIQFDFTHLVPGHSPIRKSADADRPGVRISVIRDHVSTLLLYRVLNSSPRAWTTAPSRQGSGSASARRAITCRRSSASSASTAAPKPSYGPAKRASGGRRRAEGCVNAWPARSRARRPAGLCH